jgi:hypothetical protein
VLKQVEIKEGIFLGEKARTFQLLNGILGTHPKSLIQLPPKLG